MRILILLMLVLVSVSCDRSMDESREPAPDLQGDWMLYERGYSPGSGYIVEPVSASPAQTLRFLDHQQVVIAVQGLEEYKFYTADRDADQRLTFLKLYKLEPENSRGEEDPLLHFIVEQNEDVMKLFQIGCDEGCHLGFKRIANRIE